MTAKDTKAKPARQSKAAGAKPSAKSGRNDALQVTQKADEREHLATAKAIVAPDFRHGVTVAQIMKPQMGASDFAPGAGDYADAVQERANGAAEGDLRWPGGWRSTWGSILARRKPMPGSP
jgi:hypothetical protein